MSRKITSVLFPSSTSYTDEMWLGDEPSGVSRYFGSSGGIEYVFEHGQVHLVSDEICACNVTIKEEYCVCIVGRLLTVSKITGDFLNNKSLKMDYIQNTASFSGKAFSVSDLNIISKPQDEDPYIVCKVKKFVCEKIKTFCETFKSKMGYLPSEFKDWFLQ